MKYLIFSSEEWITKINSGFQIQNKSMKADISEKKELILCARNLGRSLSNFVLLAVAVKRIIKEDQEEDEKNITHQRKRTNIRFQKHKKLPFEYCQYFTVIFLRANS